MHRLVNIGSTGYRRSWTDNLLWHHMAHILDLALWLGGGGDTALALSQLADFQSVEAARRPLRDLPMDVLIQGRLGEHTLFSCAGSYQNKLAVTDMTIVTDREAYAVDGRANVVKVNVDESLALASEYAVQSIPAFIVVRDGDATQRLVGMQTKQALVKAIAG